MSRLTALSNPPLCWSAFQQSRRRSMFRREQVMERGKFLV